MKESADLTEFLGKKVKVVFNDLQKNGKGGVKIDPKTAEGILTEVRADHIVIDNKIAIFRNTITFIKKLEGS